MSMAEPRMTDKIKDTFYRPHEGKTTRIIERRTSQVPSGTYLALAIGSMALSAGISFIGKRRELGNFVGLWAPTILIMGLYNKLIKVEGS
jgi:hypothetical protein